MLQAGSEAVGLPVLTGKMLSSHSIVISDGQIIVVGAKLLPIEAASKISDLTTLIVFSWALLVVSKKLIKKLNSLYCKLVVCIFDAGKLEKSFAYIL